jgi:20S proteasome subunit alpha 5
MEEKISATNIQVATVTADKGYQLMKESELVELIAALS